jgi:hypothetical protein
MCAMNEPRAWATIPVYDTMPVDELAAVWNGLQQLGARDQTEQSWAATLYFDRLPHDVPDRALDLALAVLRSDAEKRIKMQLGDRLMSALIYHHSDRLNRGGAGGQSGAALAAWRGALVGANPRVEGAPRPDRRRGPLAR